MADDLISALRSLANRWAMTARDFNRDAKAEGDATKAAHNRGYAEGYYRAATELANVLKENGDKPVAAASGAAQKLSVAPQPPAAAPAATYAAVSVGDALTTLSYAGSEPRDIEARPDNSFRAVFSRWENVRDHERVDKLKLSDNRIVVITSGRTKDTNDPFIEFAFKPI